MEIMYDINQLKITTEKCGIFYKQWQFHERVFT